MKYLGNKVGNGLALGKVYIINNADKMINELSIEYNKTRQFAITQEIIEVVSGANAQLG